MTRAEAMVVSELMKGATVVDKWQIRTLTTEDGQRFAPVVDHYHLEAFEAKPVSATTELVPIANSGTWFGVCTCGTRFFYQPDTT